VGGVRKTVSCEHTGVQMKRVFLMSVLAMSAFLAPSYAQEENAITGTLSGYGKNHVVVDGKRIELCRNYRVYDDLDEEISMDGLVATETVMVVFKGDCAATVKALLVRR